VCVCRTQKKITYLLSLLFILITDLRIVRLRDIDIDLTLLEVALDCYDLSLLTYEPFGTTARQQLALALTSDFLRAV